MAHLARHPLPAGAANRPMLHADYGLDLTESDPTYSAYSPTPSSIEAHQHRHQRVSQWTHDIPPAARGAAMQGRSVGAGSATWSEDAGLDTVPEGAELRRPMEQEHSLHSAPSLRGSRDSLRAVTLQPSAQSLRPRAPPVPLLAQSPRQVDPSLLDLPRGEAVYRPGGSPSPSQKSTRSERAELEAYLTSALQLPLEMISEVQPELSQQRPSPRKPSRVGTLLGRTKSAHSLKPTTPPTPPPLPLDRARSASATQLPGTVKRRSQSSLRNVDPTIPKVTAGPRPDGRISMVRSASSPLPVNGRVAPPQQVQPPFGAQVSRRESVDSAYSQNAPGTQEVILMPTNQLTPPSSSENIEPLPASQLARRSSSRVPSTGGLSPTTFPLSRSNSRAEAAKPEATSVPPQVGHVGHEPQASPQVLKTVEQSQAPPVPAKVTPRGSHISLPDGIRFTPSSASVESLRDRGDHISFDVPTARRGRLQVSLSWLPHRRADREREREKEEVQRQKEQQRREREQLARSRQQQREREQAERERVRGVPLPATNPLWGPGSARPPLEQPLGPQPRGPAPVPIAPPAMYPVPPPQVMAYPMQPMMPPLQVPMPPQMAYPAAPMAQLGPMTYQPAPPSPPASPHHFQHAPHPHMPPLPHLHTLPGAGKAHTYPGPMYMPAPTVNRWRKLFGNWRKDAAHARYVEREREAEKEAEKRRRERDRKHKRASGVVRDNPDKVKAKALRRSVSASSLREGK